MRSNQLHHVHDVANVEAPAAVVNVPDTAAISLMPPLTISAEERSRLVGICLRATRDRDAAEDLAQETLLEGWRQRHKLRDAHDPRARAQWLAAIAGHICRRWARSHGRDLARTTRLDPTDDGPETPAAQLAARDEIDIELEQAERAELLDRALGLLPPETRAMLIDRYLIETAPSEIAARHGLSEATLSVRLHRGRAALRQLFATTLREEALSYGLLPASESAEPDGWQETRIWCPLCGHARLRGVLDGPPVRLLLRCPHCGEAEGDFIEHVSFQGILDGMKTFKAALNRVMVWGDHYYREGAATREVVCRCGHAVPLVKSDVALVSLARPAEFGLRARCTCHAVNHTEIAGMALFTPEARRFWRTHPRIRLTPKSFVEADGREAIVVGYESVTDSARIDVLFARDTYELLAVHAPPGMP